MADYVNFYQIEEKVLGHWCLTPKLNGNQGFCSYIDALKWANKNLLGSDYRIISNRLTLKQWEKQKAKFNLQFVG